FLDGGFVVPDNNSYGHSFRDYGAESERKEMVEELYRLIEMSIWECCELLNEVVDDSDPDLDEPQIQHLLQTILGKCLPSFGGLPQWAVVGDTFPLGCAFDQSIVHYDHFKGNPDYNNPAYNTKFGIYSEGCGLDNVLMSWGMMTTSALFIIRYHSFYSLHKSGAYEYLMNEEDVENLKWLQIFNKYDLYSKSKVKIDVDKVKPYYISLVEKYFPSKLKW
ncbi:hypothetical protein Pfo_015433, partial [Paulownia fortunei]